MSNVFPAQFDSPEYHAALSVVRELRGHDHVAYLAGGCVRDLLLGYVPKDFDVATDARPEQIASYFKRTASVGAAFGVMLVRDFNETIEVATFRADGVYSDARRPDSVEFSSPSEDAQRRDFTINALFFDPFADEDRRVIDFVDGLSDVKQMVLRAVGNPADRLQEDHLRALRAVRFASKYGLTIDERTKNAIKEHARSLSGVSIERIGEEVRRMLTHPNRTQACIMIDELELDDAIFHDEHEFDPSVMQRLDEAVEYPIALAALAIGRGFIVGADATEIAMNYRRSLDLSNADHTGLRCVLECLACFEHEWDEMGIAQRKRQMSRPWSVDSLSLYHTINEDHARIILTAVNLLAGEHGGLKPSAFVSGADLIELGYKPGPEFKEILDAVYDLQLEGRVLTQPDAIEWVQKQINTGE